MSGLILKPQTAKVFAPLWTQGARFKGAHGGRGSGKSNDRAQAVILRMVTKPGSRIVCLREVQNSIKDSVYQLLCDWIERLGVGKLFDITRRGAAGIYARREPYAGCVQESGAGWLCGDDPAEWVGAIIAALDDATACAAVHARALAWCRAGAAAAGWP